MIETLAPSQGIGYADAGEKVGERKPGTPEGKGSKDMIPGWEIIKGILFDDA